MTTMNPADVPDDLVQVVRAADDAYIDARTEDDPFDRDDHARAIAAAVLPLVEQQVRAAVGAELQRLAVACTTHPDAFRYDPQCVRCHRYNAILSAAYAATGENQGPRT